jgi:hypothetical protein
VPVVFSTLLPLTFTINFITVNIYYKKSELKARFFNIQLVLIFPPTLLPPLKEFLKVDIAVVIAVY